MTDDRNVDDLEEARARLERLAVGLAHKLDPLDVGGTFVGIGFCILAAQLGRDRALAYIQDFASEVEDDHDTGWGGTA